MHDQKRSTWNSLPRWKKAAIKAAREQNTTQRMAARVAVAGFGHCTTGAVVSVIR